MTFSTQLSSTQSSSSSTESSSKGFFGKLFSNKVRTVSAMLSCSAIAVLGTVSPALANSRQLWLHDGESTMVSGYFYAGEVIFGDCDQDCYDLDLHLYSDYGDLVDSDVAYDAFPVVVAPYDGTFSVEVNMLDCNHIAGCAVSVGSEYGF